MKTLVVNWAAVIGFLLTCPSHAQENVVQDSARMKQELPKLEIPEITIVGKKAITLPFARKGEIFDVPLTEVPPPDSGVLLDRPIPGLPVGNLPRYHQQEMPWRLSLEGYGGSFATGSLTGYLDYNQDPWGIAGTAGYSRTDGHTANSSRNTTLLGINSHSRLATDNDFLGALRATGSMEYVRDTYGLFGRPPYDMERRRNDFLLEGAIASIHRGKTALDVMLSAHIESIRDSHAAVDSEVSAVSPLLQGSVTTPLAGLRWVNEFRYAGSALDYQQGAAESPSLLTVASSAGWQATPVIFFQAGLRFAAGTDSRGGSRNLFLPTASGTWTLDSGRALSVWFQPSMELVPFHDHFRQNPYLDREIEIRPSRLPFNAGATFWYNNGLLTLALDGSFARRSDAPVTIADSGRLRITYIDALEAVVRVQGSIQSGMNSRLKFAGTLHPAKEDGNTTQLPMTSFLTLSGRGELDLPAQFTIWSTVEYWSKQNVDIDGTQTLGDVALMGAGISSSVIPRAFLSFEISNLLNTAYQWWSGYPAPGRQFLCNLKVNLR